MSLLFLFHPRVAGAPAPAPAAAAAVAVPGGGGVLRNVWRERKERLDATAAEDEAELKAFALIAVQRIVNDYFGSS